MNQPNPLFLNLTMSILLFFLFTSSSYAVEVNELDEITMQVLDIDATSEFNIQEMVAIPIPINNDMEMQSQKNFAKPRAIDQSNVVTEGTSPIIENR